MTDSESKLKEGKAKRKQVKGSLTRQHTYLSEVSAEEVSIIELRQRLQKVSELWGAFEEAQSAIEECEHEEKYDSSHLEVRKGFEDRYFAATVGLETLIASKLEASRTTTQLRRDLTQNVTERRETPLSQGSNLTNEHLKLPRITLPEFSGKYDDWIPFRNMFQSMFHDNLTIPNTQKMQFLLASLTGEAKGLVSSLEPSDENYLEAWQMLKDRYDDDGAIIQRHVKSLFEQPVLPRENHRALRRILDNMLKHIRALKALKRPTDKWDDLLIQLLTSRLDQVTNKEWETSLKKGEIPTFTQLTEFLSQRCRALEASSRTQRSGPLAAKGTSHEQGKGTTAHVATTNVMCAHCGKGDHSIYKCSNYLELGVDQRIKEAKSRKLCLNCLKVATHQAKQCGSGSCRRCGKRHNTLLHLEQAAIQEEPAGAKISAEDKIKVVATSVNHAANHQGKQVLLATAVVYILNAKGRQIPCRALLDNGSQSCFITDNCVERLGIKRHGTYMPISGLGELSTQTRTLVKVTLQSRINGFQVNLDCLVIGKITQNIPVNRLSLQELRIPEGITLADPDFDKPSQVDLLLGAEVFFELLCIGKIKIADGQPTWQKTLLGWIVSGSLLVEPQTSKATICGLVVNEQLNENLARFWQIEYTQRQNTRTPEERICEGHFAQTYMRNSDGRFTVTLPTKQGELYKLGESRDIALRRFGVLERRLERDPQLKMDYANFVHEYLELKHMRELKSEDAAWYRRPHYYLPHHCVIKEASNTTRLRVVFDASSKTTSGYSLNNVLMVGPVLQQELFSILVRLRGFEYVLTADIAKMYRQVLLNEAQVSLQRIVWRDQPSEDIKTYELLTLTYGTASASFLATKVIQQLADLEEDHFPKGAAIARRDFYIDDLITGANSKEEAIIIRDQTIALLQKGGFTLRKWSSNSQELLKGLPEASTDNNLLELDKDGTAKTLGIKWNPEKDVFQYTIALETPAQGVCTKRSILASISQIFDPLGLLGPVIVNAKLIIQKLWKLQIGWDESLPSEIHTEWLDYVIKMQDLGGIAIPRKTIGAGTNLQFDLHGFCDASERAYGACIYVRSSDTQGFIQAQLLCSKSRVAPVKAISIPRLELCGAQLLTQLMDKVKSSLDIRINKCYYWTDSSIVLHWLKGTNKKLPVFAAHRVGEIQEMSTVENWNHIGTKENPADLISRGVSPRELVKSRLWWKGPTWLEDDGLMRYRLEVQEIDDNRLDEVDRSEVIAMLVHEDIDLFTRFSTFNKLVRVTATCLRFVQLCRKQYSGEASGPLSVVEIEYARRSLIKGAQRAYFSSELEALKDGRAVSGRSNLRDMNPFIDADGLLRVGGRLRHSRLQHDAKHPVLLPRCSRLTELIIEHEHKKLLHAGVEATLAAIRLSYWPIRARGTIKRIIRQCVVCFKARPRLSEQLMGDLPSCRVTPSKPFSNTGVDFCGPIYIKEGKRRSSKRIKAYVAVFICMATKAVHLEVVSELSTDAFLNSFKRFIGRRGRPTDVFSDNGTNFVGANRELEELRNLLAKEEHQRKIVNATSSDGIKWHFIPPRAPHFGGLWEAAVKSFKAHFYKVASEAALSFEEATTLVIQVEAILNSRPLIALSSDANDLSYISPGHFLIGDALVAYPEPDLAHIKIGRLSRWQRVEQIRQHFWQRWSSEYLLQLQRRSKWTMNRGMQLQVGQLVLCREDGLPPLKWLLGRVQEVCPGSDGIVRAAVIKTSKGAFKRPAVRLSRSNNVPTERQIE